MVIPKKGKKDRKSRRAAVSPIHFSSAPRGRAIPERYDDRMQFFERHPFANPPSLSLSLCFFPSPSPLPYKYVHNEINSRLDRHLLASPLYSPRYSRLPSPSTYTRASRRGRGSARIAYVYALLAGRASRDFHADISAIYRLEAFSARDSAAAKQHHHALIGELSLTDKVILIPLRSRRASSFQEGYGNYSFGPFVHRSHDDDARRDDPRWPFANSRGDAAVIGETVRGVAK